VVWHGRSADRRVSVQLLERRDEQYVSVDGVTGPPFDGIAPATIVLSPDGSRLAYAAERDGRWQVVDRGVAGPAFDGIGAVLLSPDGGRLAYAGTRGGGWHVVVDGDAGPAFDDLLAGSLAFSADGGRIAYAGVRGELAHPVIDGRVGPGYPALAALGFDDAGGRVAYLVRGEFGDRLMIDGNVVTEHSAIAEYALGAGGRFAVVADDGAGWFVAIDGVPGPTHVQVRALAFSADGRHVAYVAGDGTHERVVLDGRGGRPFARIGELVLAAGGRHSYTAEIEGLGVVVADDETYGPYLWVGNPVFSPDGTRHAFLVRRGAEMLVFHDHGVAAFDVVLDGSLVYAADGRHWACLAGSFAERELRLVVDGRPTGRIFDWDELVADVSLDPLAYVSDERTAELFRSWTTAELALELGR
jgi:hypothetical protein